MFCEYFNTFFKNGANFLQCIWFSNDFKLFTWYFWHFVQDCLKLFVYQQEKRKKCLKKMRNCVNLKYIFVARFGSAWNHNKSVSNLSIGLLYIRLCYNIYDWNLNINILYHFSSYYITHKFKMLFCAEKLVLQISYIQLQIRPIQHN